MGRPTVTVENFWNRVGVRGPDDCWNWTGPTSRSRTGQQFYGRIDFQGIKGVYVHRIAYWICYDRGLTLRKCGDVLVRHSCDNSLCCNPTHLEIGTHQDNMDDKVNRGRARVCPPGTAHPRAVFTADDVMAIRAIAGTMTRKMIAKKYGVSRSAVDSVITGRTYRDIS